MRVVLLRLLQPRFGVQCTNLDTGSFRLLEQWPAHLGSTHSVLFDLIALVDSHTVFYQWHVQWAPSTLWIAQILYHPTWYDLSTLFDLKMLQRGTVRRYVICKLQHASVYSHPRMDIIFCDKIDFFFCVCVCGKLTYYQKTDWQYVTQYKQKVHLVSQVYSEIISKTVCKI